MSLQAKVAVTHSLSAISLTYSGTLRPVMTVISRKLSSHRVYEPRGQTFLEGFFRHYGKSCSSMCLCLGTQEQSPGFA